MSEYMRDSMKPWRRVLLASVLGVTVGLTLLVAMPTLSPANAENRGQKANVADCFGGVLSEEPLHCHALQQAHNAGIIEVDAIYQIGEILEFYLTQTTPVSGDTLKYIREQALAEARSTGYRPPTPQECGSDLPWCYVGLMVIDDINTFALPPTASYENIRLFPGGSKARLSRPGWASYRQVWPEVEGNESRDRRSDDASGFDVSGVDTTNFPNLRCMFKLTGGTGQSCGFWSSIPEARVAGFRDLGGGENRRLQWRVKVTPGDEEAQLAAAKEAIIQWNPDGLNDNNVVVVPVKNDYGDYLRWAIVLNRFANSEGNTIGMYSANIGENHGGFRGRAEFVLESLPDEGMVRAESIERYRTTLHIWTYDQPATVEALPTLLSQLGIPVDAVGVVIQYGDRPMGATTPDVLDTGANYVVDGGVVAASDHHRGSDFLLWQAAAVTIALAVVLLSAAFLIVSRMIRKHS